MPRTIIKNGTIVTASAIYPSDVLIEGGRIAAIGKAWPERDARVIDARGCYVMPGGIDVHTHLDSQSWGCTTADDFESGTIAAACGGTTSIVDFCQQQPNATLKESLAEWHRRAGGKAVIDYGFHIIVNNPTDEIIDELVDMPSEGVTSFKLFMAYRKQPGISQVDDYTILRAMKNAEKSGAVVMVHAENGDACHYLQQECLAKGEVSPKYHAVSRPPRTEAEATARAIALAEVSGSSLYVVHLTCEAALEELLRGRMRGVKVFAETCTHYLYCTVDDLAKPDFEGAKYVFTPPVRTKRDHEVLWHALEMGLLKAVSSDHSPWNFHGHKDKFGKNDFTKIPNGAPGIEERMMMTYQGVNEGRFALDRFVDIVSTNPARLFGLYPKKGTIAVGSDADIVIWDPEAEITVTKPAIHGRVDYTLFEGMRAKGLPRTVLLRGNVIVENRDYVGGKGGGEFLRRDRFSPIAL